MVAREPKASLDRRLRAAATTFWFAVQRLARRRAEGPTTEPERVVQRTIPLRVRQGIESSVETAGHGDEQVA